MARIKIEVGEAELKDLIVQHLENKLGDVTFDPKNVEILVKSKQNYKSEWEIAAFKATLEVTV